jgi:hypothetical protein
MTSRLLIEALDVYGKVTLLTAHRVIVWMIEGEKGSNKIVDEVLIEQDPDGIVVKDAVPTPTGRKKNVTHR